MAVEIKTVSLIGLGALGLLFGRQMQNNMPQGSLRVIADEKRAERYRREGFYVNGEPVSFNTIAPGAPVPPADLVMFAVKYTQLDEAIAAAQSQVGKDTLVISLLNGVTSEERLAAAYGAEKVLYCVAAGMDTTRTGNRLEYKHMGGLSIGEGDGSLSERAKALAAFFEKTQVPCELATDMKYRLWAKFMVNAGLNQASMVYGADYGALQKEGEARSAMIAAMKEVIPVAAAEGVMIRPDELDKRLAVIATLLPSGKPSMGQDADAKRPSEVEMLGGAMVALGEKHGIETPVNRMFYQRIKEIEQTY